MVVEIRPAHSIICTAASAREMHRTGTHMQNTEGDGVAVLPGREHAEKPRHPHASLPKCDHMRIARRSAVIGGGRLLPVVIVGLQPAHPTTAQLKKPCPAHPVSPGCKNSIYAERAPTADFASVSSCAIWLPLTSCAAHDPLKATTIIGM